MDSHTLTFWCLSVFWLVVYAIEQECWLSFQHVRRPARMSQRPLFHALLAASTATRYVTCQQIHVIRYPFPTPKALEPTRSTPIEGRNGIPKNTHIHTPALGCAFFFSTDEKRPKTPHCGLDIAVKRGIKKRISAF